MPPFAAYWSQEDRRNRLGISRFLFRKGWLAAPTSNQRKVFKGCLKHLAASRARVLLVNMEDLWLETAPQNIPGTTQEYPNWRRKARRDIEEFTRLPGVLKLLQEINRLRKGRVLK